MRDLRNAHELERRKGNGGRDETGELVVASIPASVKTGRKAESEPPECKPMCDNLVQGSGRAALRGRLTVCAG